MILTQLGEQLGTLTWIAACVLALVIGGRPERQVAVALAADLASVVLLPQLNVVGRTHLWTALGDVVVLAVMVAVWRAHPRTRWLPAAIGFQVLAILAHMPSLFDPAAASWGYLTVTTFCGYAVVGALALGALLARTTDGTDA